MKTKNKLLSVVTLSCLLSAGALAGEYYVSPEGTGDNCTIGNPCSFQTALDKAENDGENSTIYVAGGTYKLVSSLRYSGKNNLRIIALDPDSKPILDGSNSTTIMDFDSCGDVSIEGLVFRNGKDDYGGGLYIYGAGDISLLNSEFYDNIGGYYGGGVYIEIAGDVLVENSTFMDNKVDEYGGALYIYSAKNITVKNTNFTKNSSEEDGAGIYVRNVKGSLVVENSTFTENVVEENGGAVYADVSGSMIIRNSMFEHNTADDYGGAVYVSSDVNTVLIDNSTLKENLAGEGAGIYVYIDGKGYVSIRNSYFEQNNSTHNYGEGGGGVCISGGGNIEILYSEFDSCSSKAQGGGVSINSEGNVTVKGSIFDRNLAEGEGGGGLNVSSEGEVTLMNCLFINNKGSSDGVDEYGGGGALILANKVNLINNSWVGNSVTEGGSGGGLYLYLENSNSEASLYNNIFWSNNATKGSDVFVNCEGYLKVFNNDLSCEDISWDNETSCFYIYLRALFAGGNCTVKAVDNFSQDPKFVDPANRDFHLQKNSPCIDAGNNTAPGLPEKDIEGNERVIDGDKDGNAVVDVGAYEFVPNNPPEIEKFSASPDKGLAPLEVVFAWNATDADGDNLTCSLSFGDGNIWEGDCSLGQKSYVYETPGSYTVVLTVSDGKGGTASQSVEVSVAKQVQSNTASIGCALSPVPVSEGIVNLLLAVSGLIGIRLKRRL